ncbi:MAG TPA: pilus assembly protein TadG-related protein [Xanthobacteraceae bacterium]|nr:pilus assembly protein TadG-related protein [Xanthobacteraceae bacterium]
MLRVWMHRFSRDRQGNVALIFALSMIPCVFLVGMGLDFTAATQKRVQLNAAADAAALAAVTPGMMTQTTSAAQTAATNAFNAVASNTAGVTSVAPTINVTSSNGGLTRTASVSYTANSTNSFPNVLKLLTGTSQTNWAISGSSTSTATTAPNIDFYLLLDNSPSMNIAATSSGISTMVANTTAQGGCAFACHESNPAADNLGNPGGEDNYTLAANLGVTTRIQNMAAATQALTTTATTVAAANNATYRMAVYTFNYSGTSTVKSLTSNLSAVSTAAASIDVLEVYDNNCLTSSCTAGPGNNDTDTDFNSAMSNINGFMPAPGTGSATSTPQEVLFLVSDGVDDKVSATCSESLSGNRCQQPFDTTWCTTVKNRGIRIAVLYTEYLPLPTNNWYVTWISPWQPTIATNLQSCASTGLYFAITTDGDISTAMQALFEQAVATARLTQ